MFTIPTYYSNSQECIFFFHKTKPCFYFLLQLTNNLEILIRYLNLLFLMLEKQTSKSRKCLNLLEDKIFSQLKRIEQLLKSGDIPWVRVKSAYDMCDEAISQMPSDIKDSYPLKHYIKLSKIIFAQFFQYFQGPDSQDLTTKIQAKILGQEKSILLKLGGRISMIDYESTNLSSCVSQQKSNVIQKIYETKADLVETQLKQILDQIDANKAAILQELTKGQNNKNFLSHSLKSQINQMFEFWKKQAKQKYQQQRKWVEQTKNQYQLVLKMKDQQITAMSIQLARLADKKSHCSTQTVDFQRFTEIKLKQIDLQFTFQKEKFIKITSAYQKQINELKKQNKQIKNSHRQKLAQCQKNTSLMVSSLRSTKEQFKKYVEEIKDIKQIFFNAFERHQKAKTPFIPKIQIIEVYQKMKKNNIKENHVFSIVLDEKQELLKKSLGKDQACKSKGKKQASAMNDLLVNVTNSSKVNSFYSPKRLRSSQKSNLAKQQTKKDIDDCLPLLKVFQCKQLTLSKGKHEVKSLHNQTKVVIKPQQNNFPITSKKSENILSTQLKKEQLVGFQREVGKSLYNESSEDIQKRIIRTFQETKHLIPEIKSLSKHHIPLISSSLDFQESKQRGDKQKKHKKRVHKQKISRQNAYKNILNLSFCAQNQQRQDVFNFKRNGQQTSQNQCKVKGNPVEDIQEDQKKSQSFHMIESKTRLPLSSNQTLIAHKSIQKSQYFKQERMDKSLHYKKQVVRQSSSDNFVNEINLFFKKYSQKLEMNIEMDCQIQQQIEQIKMHHSLCCGKTACHHLRKFYQKLKILKYQESNKKFIKINQIKNTI